MAGENNPFYGRTHTLETRKKLSQSHIGKFQPKGKDSNNWKGGRLIQKGYVSIYQPEHPFAYARGYIREHRLVMEKHLGRYLKPQEVVHHKNGVKTDNRIKNLELFPNHKTHWEARHV